MADISQKVPLGPSLNKIAQRKALDHIHMTGKSLPASVSKRASGNNAIFKVKFEVNSGFSLPEVTIPIFGPEYTRYPIQVGDKGIVLSADMLFGNISGLGANAAPGTTRPGNLSPLVFLPIGNANWSKSDPDTHKTYGKMGTSAGDTEGKSTVTTHPDHGTQMQTGNGSHSVTAHPSNGVGVASSIAHTIAAPNAKLDKAGNFKASQSINAPTGSFGSLFAGAGGGGGGGNPITGTLSGDVIGPEADTEVVGITHVANAHTLPVAASDTAAAAAGVAIGGLYVNKTAISGQNLLCVRLT